MLHFNVFRLAVLSYFPFSFVIYDKLQSNLTKSGIYFKPVSTE